MSRVIDRFSPVQLSSDATGLESALHHQTDVPVTSEQMVELNRRLAAYEIDRNRGRLVADVLADVRRRLRRQR